MRRTVDLPEGSQSALHDLAGSFGLDDDDALRTVLEAMLAQDRPISEKHRRFLAYVGERLAQAPASIRSSPDVLGGDARIRSTRIPVWLVVAHKKWGESDAEILAQYPSLNVADLASAWDYYAANSERVDAERRANEDAE